MKLNQVREHTNRACVNNYISNYDIFLTTMTSQRICLINTCNATRKHQINFMLFQVVEMIRRLNYNHLQIELHNQDMHEGLGIYKSTTRTGSSPRTRTFTSTSHQIKLRRNTFSLLPNDFSLSFSHLIGLHFPEPFVEHLF